jgi:MYXO-CTERM domain-containing protein
VALLVALTLAVPAADPSPRSAPRLGEPFFDALASAGPVPAARRGAAFAGSPLLHPERPLHLQEQLGVPTFLWSMPGAGAPAALLAALPETAARAHLERYAPLYRLLPGDAQAARHLSTQVTASGASLVRLAQEVDGVEVFHGRMTLLLAPDGDLVGVGGHFSPSASQLAAVGGRLAFSLDAESALVRAFADLGGGWLAAGALSGQGTLADGSLLVGHAGSPPSPLALAHPARAKRVAFETGAAVEPAWYLELDVGAPGTTSPELVAYVISARDGRLLYREPLTVDASYTYRVYADTTSPFTPWDGPQGTAGTPYPTAAPSLYAPALAPMTSDVTLQNAPFSRNDPWLPAGATETVGNNVDAYVDLGGADGYTPPGDFRATATGSVFGATFDPTLAPNTTSQRKAVIQQLFFMVNWLHDLYYDLGFDEAAGNAQTDNFGRGGLGGDPIYAEAQDSSGTNNANMSTPADGSSPRMQMYLWTTPNPDRDGGVDMGIAGHEWHHYLVGRLVTGGMGTNMAGGMNEGFADFGALLMVVRAGDTAVAPNASWGGSYATGGYALAGTVADSYYYGVRRYPYSSDFTKDPLTYKHIQTGVALPGTAPKNPAAIFATDNAEVHNEGEIWASMLWECYASLLKDSARLTFAEAQRRMRGYLVAGLKLTPANPTLVEARDALLAAIYAGDPADYTVCGAAFARRGLGSGAVSPDRFSTTNAGLAESFTFGNDVIFVSAALDDSALSCDSDHYVDPGERGRLTVTARNTGAATLTQLKATISSGNAAVTYPSGNSVTFAPLAPFATGTAVVEVAYTGATAKDTATFDVALSDPTLSGGKVVHGALAAIFDADDLPAGSATESFDAVTSTWTPGHGTGVATPEWGRVGPPGKGQAFGPDPSAQVDQWFTSPPLAVAASGSLTMVLNHAYDFEADPVGTAGRLFYDGGRIEVTTNNGTTWTDVGTTAANYPGTIANYTGTKNVLAGSRAYVGQSAGWPAMTTTTVNLGATYAGKTIRLRFRIATDEASGAGGWSIESATFTGLVGTPFTSVVANARSCTPNSAPVANAGPAQAVDERTVATLDGSASSDPDGDAITYAWTQSSGPAVTLSSATAQKPTFTVPEVTVDSAAIFGLVVTDVHGLSSTASTVTVTFRNVNRAPLADAGPNQTVDERTLATLDGSSSGDPDGDTFVYAWSQTSGPAVSLSSASAQKPTFTVPEVTATTLAGFQLVVTDSHGLASAPATVTATFRSVNRPPLAVVVGGGSAPERFTGTLDATGSSDPDGDPIGFAWTQLSGPAVTLTGAGTATPSFATPEVAADTALVFRVTVSDGTLSATAQTTFTVLQVNRAPVANAGGAQSAPERTVATLDGSASADPDGDTITWAWTQTSGPAAVLSSATAQKPTFTVPEVTVDSAAVFSLVVTDAHGLASTPATVTITLRNVNRAPAANAGGAQSVPERTVATLDGSASADPDGDTITWAWTQTSGPAAVLSSATAQKPTFTVPEVTVDSASVFGLVVTDAHGLASSASTVTVTFRNVNRAPLAVAADQQVTGVVTVTLDATGSSDPDGDALGFAWSESAGPAVTLTGAGAGTATFQSPAVTADTALTFDLQVSDGTATVHRSVEVLVHPAGGTPPPTPAPPRAGGCGCTSTGDATPVALLGLALAGGLLRRRRVRGRS